jgi:phospholipid/cholesterol/gamma-HCH transport system substrate-binding protein
METKANYILIGLFTLGGIIGAFGLLLWLAKIEVDRQYAYYDILFEDVSGLATAGDVRYNGLPVGQVVDMELDDTDASMVRIRIEVDAETPVNTETVARLQSQGVTGVSYVGLSGGSDTAAALEDGAVIRSERSALQSVFEGAPLVLDKAVALLENINGVFDETNRDAVGVILGNLSSASARLDGVLTEFETLSGDLGLAAREVAAFTDRLDALADTADGTLTTATQTLETANTAFADIGGVVRDGVPTLVETLQGTSEAATRLIETVEVEVARVSTRIDNLAESGQTTLATATRTLENADKTLTDISTAMAGASGTFDAIGSAFSKIDGLLDTDIGKITSDVSRAANALTTSVNKASAEIDAISAEVLAASQSAANFTGTLEAILVQNQRQVSEFLRLGLPEFLRFSEEARALVSNLERLVNRVERDPARFLLGTQNSEFRR